MVVTFPRSIWYTPSFSGGAGLGTDQVTGGSIDTLIVKRQDPSTAMLVEHITTAIRFIQFDSPLIRGFLYSIKQTTTFIVNCQFEY